MQIVIDIPEIKYRQIIESRKMGFLLSVLENIIANGTPLSKGHGRLIDADNTIQTVDKEYPNLDRQDIKQWLENAPTVLEADRED